MDIDSILTALRRELDQITEVIVILERMTLVHQKTRGRPPAWLAALRQNSDAKPKRRGRPRGSQNKSVTHGN